MPDENREALHYLLLFLSEVAEESDINQVRRYAIVIMLNKWNVHALLKNGICRKLYG